MKKAVFGADVGGTTVKIGLCNLDGSIIESWEIPTRREENGKYILADIAEAVKSKMTEHSLSRDDIAGIGLGVPGPVDPDGIVHGCVNLGWNTFNVERDMSEITGLKVKAGNDANVATLGEMWRGGGKGYDSIVMVTLGTGVGSGIIIDGKILAGADGASGEIGHLPMNDEETEQCGCGKRGCLEQYGSATGVVTLMRRYLGAHPEADSLLKDKNDFTAKDIFDAARLGDQSALAAVGEAADYLGKGLASAACLIDPQAFVIGGGMSRAGDFLIDMIRERYQKHAFHASRDIPFKLATLGNNAGIVGSVKMIV